MIYLKCAPLDHYDPDCYSSSTTEREAKAIWEAHVDLLNELSEIRFDHFMQPSTARLAADRGEYISEEALEEFQEFYQKTWHKAISIGLQKVANNEDEWSGVERRINYNIKNSVITRV